MGNRFERRSFLQMSGLASGGLFVPVALPGAEGLTETAEMWTTRPEERDNARD